MSRRRYFVMANTFTPSGYSYGDAATTAPPATSAEEESSAKVLAEWMPAIRTALGVDDPRKQLAMLQNRLRDLQYGTPAEQGAAMLAAGSLTIPGAIAKTRHRIEDLEKSASQSKARDRLYTMLVVSGVTVGGMLTLYIGVKTYQAFRSTK
jgi:hypothetical protein